MKTVLRKPFYDNFKAYLCTWVTILYTYIWVLYPYSINCIRLSSVFHWRISSVSSDKIISYTFSDSFSSDFSGLMFFLDLQ